MHVWVEQNSEGDYLITDYECPELIEQKNHNVCRILFLNNFYVKIPVLIYNMERRIYLSGFKTKLWAKFNMLLLP